MTGRIYRIVPEKGRLFPKPNLSKTPSPELIAYLSHANGWWRDTAQRLLVERDEYRLASSLRKLARSGANPLGRLHALWTLAGIHVIDPPTAMAALGDAEPMVRAAALRLCDQWLTGPKQAQTVAALLKLIEDPDPRVRLQLCLSLSPLGLNETDGAMLRMLQDGGETVYVRDAVIGGLRGRELEFLERVLQAADYQNSSTGRAAVIKALAQCVITEGSQKRVARPLELG